MLWLVSPAIAWWISRPLARREARLTAEQTRFLGRIARKTWAFFETFVGPEDHWLPPDNYQEYRAAALAHRTSPTNMGLALLANLSAYDFGYIPAGQAARAHRPHPGDAWRDWNVTGATSTTGTTRRRCSPLQPVYVSTVDSGNLAGHLLTLRPGLLALLDRPDPGDALAGRPWRHPGDTGGGRRRGSRRPTLAQFRRRSNRGAGIPAGHADGGAASARPPGAIRRGLAEDLARPARRASQAVGGPGAGPAMPGDAR